MNKERNKVSYKVIALIALLLVVDALFCGLIFYYQSKNIEKEYKETRQNQITTLTDLSSEALAGGDFFFLSRIISQFRQQSPSDRAFIITHSQQKIIASTHEEDYGKVFNKQDLVVTLSQPAELFRSPINYGGKKWAELVIIYDKAPVNKKKTTLIIGLIITGGLIFFMGALLVFGAGKLAARSFKHIPKTWQPQSIDVFTVPKLKHSTVIAVHNPLGSELKVDELSPQEQRIMYIISPHKTVHDILKDSFLDEPITFEIISKLLAHGKVHILED